MDWEPDPDNQGCAHRAGEFQVDPKTGVHPKGCGCTAYQPAGGAR